MRICDDGDWRRALDDPAVRFLPSLAGHPRGRVRMARDWDTEERILDVHLVYACRRGRIDVVSGGMHAQMRSGEICLIPPGVPFRFRAIAQPVLARFRLAVGAPDGAMAWGAAARVATMDAAAERLVDLLVDELHAGSGDGLAADLARAWCRAMLRCSAAVGRRSRLTGDQLARLAAEVARRPCATAPRDLARALGTSADWAARLIRVATGAPPRTWILRQRIRLAADLLDEGLTPAAVAARLGYRDPRLFGRQFRAVIGSPPGAWRRRSRRE